MRDRVDVVGVGMHPFREQAPPLRDMACTAGVAALEDAGISFREVGALYNGYIGGGTLEGGSFAKDLGLTGVPVVHVENASATGSSAFREAVLSVAGGGAAAAIVANEVVARRLARGRPLVRVIASQLQSEHYTEGQVFMGAVVGPPHLTRIMVHVHDAFPIEELMYYELLGICADGEGDKLVSEGATALGGRIPFSTDGGLIGRGHPGGPTGLAQTWDITQQLRGESGPRQVRDAQLGLAHMMGAGSVCAIHLLERVR